MIPIFFLAIALTEVVCLTASIVGFIFAVAYKHLSWGLVAVAWGFGASLLGLIVLVSVILVNEASPSFGPFDAWVIYNLFRAVCFGVVIGGFSLAFQDVASSLSRNQSAREGKPEACPDPFVLTPQENLAPWHPIREHENGVQHWPGDGSDA